MIGRVYKIASEKCGLVYIGSTFSSLSVRLARHYSSMKRWLAGKFNNCASHQILEYDDAKIELIEELEVADRNELRRHEGRYQQTMECVNKKIAGRTQQEYREENKEEIIAHKKKYYEENKEEIIANVKKYREENKEEINAKHTCECGGKYTQHHKSSHMKTKKHQDYINREK